MAARIGVELKIQTVATSFLITQESSVFEQKFRPTSFSFSLLYLILVGFLLFKEDHLPFLPQHSL